MDKIGKALKKLNKKERALVEEILQKLLAKDFQGLDIKKLKGRDDIFRVRKGNVRIIYRIANSNDFFILAIERKSEKTYKNI